MTAQVSQAEAKPQETQEKTPSQSFSELRKQLEAEKQEKEAMKKRLEALERAPKIQKPIEDEDESDEPYVEPKTLKRKLAAFEQTIEEKIDKRAEEKARAMMNEEKRVNYYKQNPDFEEIMNADVVQKFAQKYPNIAESLMKMPDTFERQQLVYENIKALGVNKKEEAPKIQDTIQNGRRKQNIFYHPADGSPPYAGQADFSPSSQKNAYEKLKQLKARIGVS